jgi:hypothetical protein
MSPRQAMILAQLRSQARSRYQSPIICFGFPDLIVSLLVPFLVASPFRQSGVVPAGTDREGSLIEPEQRRPAGNRSTI